jgi:hypothetical protein
MQKTTFNTLPPNQQEEILKLIKSDFRAAKDLYNSYTLSTNKVIRS